jgi:hypothetical protein
MKRDKCTLQQAKRWYWHTFTHKIEVYGWRIWMLRSFKKLGDI